MLDICTYVTVCFVCFLVPPFLLKDVCQTSFIVFGLAGDVIELYNSSRRLLCITVLHIGTGSLLLDTAPFLYNYNYAALNNYLKILIVQY